MSPPFTTLLEWDSSRGTLTANSIVAAYCKDDTVLSGVRGSNLHCSCPCVACSYLVFLEFDVPSHTKHLPMELKWTAHRAQIGWP